MGQATFTATITRVVSIPGAGVMNVYGTLAVSAAADTYATGGLVINGLAGTPGIGGAAPLELTAYGALFQMMNWDRAGQLLRIFQTKSTDDSQLEEWDNNAALTGMDSDTFYFKAVYLIGE